MINGYINSQIADNPIHYWTFELVTWVILPALVFTIERVESSPVVLRVGPLRDGRHLVLREGRGQLYEIPPHAYRSLVQGFGIAP